MISDEQSIHGLSIQRNLLQQNIEIAIILGKELRYLENVSAKECLLYRTSTPLLGFRASQTAPANKKNIQAQFRARHRETLASGVAETRSSKSGSVTPHKP